MEQLVYCIHELENTHFNKMIIEFDSGLSEIKFENGKFSYIDSRFIILDLYINEILEYMKLISNTDYKCIYLLC
jgi:hypothetical protein